MTEGGPHEYFHFRAPSTWQNELSSERLRELMNRKLPVHMIVMSLDIRSSTLLMKEAIDLVKFAETIGSFVTTTTNVLRKERAWLDKFTGDGFLAYWIVDTRQEESYYDEVLNTAVSLLLYFRKRTEAE